MTTNSNSLKTLKGIKKVLEDELLENILIERSQVRNIQKIKERKSNKVVNDGDNYVSLTWQEVVKVTNKQGKIWEEKIIVKSLPEGVRAKAFIENEGIFKKEIEMYTEILPKMEKLMHENAEECGERLWPRCVGMKPYSVILLEDLTAKGFQKVDRRIGLDYEHSLIAFKAIAKFHALSIPLIEDLMLKSAKFIKFDKTKNLTRRLDMIKLKIISLVKLMRAEWEPKWQRLADHLEEKTDEILNRFSDLCEVNDNAFNVLNHGDPWISNMLFKYSEFNGKVIGIRFIDYQMRHYNSFSIDLSYLLRTSVQTDVVKHHYNDLLTAYHESLLVTARKIGLSNIEIPSIEKLTEEMKSKTLVGLIFAIFLLDMMLVEPCDAMDLDTILQNVEMNKQMNNKSSKFQERIRSILEPYIDKDFTRM